MHTTNFWPELSANLRERRNLQCRLFPVEQIGSLASRGRWESERDFNARIESHRNQERRERRALGLSPDQISARIAVLQEREAQLWRLCRPDLVN